MQNKGGEGEREREREHILHKHSLFKQRVISSLWTFKTQAPGQTLQQNSSDPLPLFLRYLGRHWHHSHDKSLEPFTFILYKMMVTWVASKPVLHICVWIVLFLVKWWKAWEWGYNPIFPKSSKIKQNLEPWGSILRAVNTHVPNCKMKCDYLHRWWWVRPSCVPY